MTLMRKHHAICALLWLFIIVWFGTVAVCWADGDGQPSNPGDPADIPPGCRITAQAEAFQAADETLEPASGILSGFWMILMAMACDLTL
jgi:hypothetical protein